MNLPDNMTLRATLESGRKEAAQRSLLAEGIAWTGRIAILSAVIVSPWLIGGVQHWAQFWIAIAALIGLAFWWFETALYKKDKQVLPYVLLPVVIGFAIGLFQLMPLPDGLSNLLLGRQTELYERYTVDGQVIEDGIDVSHRIPKRISLNQEGTKHHLRLMIIAIAGLLLGCRLFRTRRDIFLLLSAITINGVALALFGLVQQLTTNGQLLYWSIPLTQGGRVFGPFVNRNNAAGYLLLCLAGAIGLLGMVVEQRRTVGPNQMVSREIPVWRQFNYHLLHFIADLTATKLSAILAIVVLATGVMASLSRGGVLAMLGGGIATILFYGLARRPKNTGFLLLPLVILTFALSSWIGFGDALIDRFEGFDAQKMAQQEQRVKNWTDTFPATREMGVLGSGLGSYSGVHRLYRADRETKLFRFAENQYFQSLVESGWPGFLVYLMAWGICWSYVILLIYRGTSSNTVALGVAGVFLLVSQGIASFFDFGFYIPANMLLFAVMIGFIGYHAHGLAGRLKQRSWLQFQTPNVFVQGVLLLVFAGVTVAALDLYRKSDLDMAMEYNFNTSHYDSPNLEQTNAAIEKISPLVKRTTSVEGLNYLGDLWVHRARLEFFEQLVSLPGFNLLEGEEEEKTKEELWNYTQLGRMHENVHYLSKDVSQYQAARFLEYDFIAQNLPGAMNYYQVSRQLSPLQPQVHKQIGKINSLIGSNDAASADFERAVELAPTNAELRLTAGEFYLQAGRMEAAAPHFRRVLELDPDRFKSVLQLLTGRSNKKIDPVDESVIFETIIPDDPEMLFQFAMRFMDESSPNKLEVLEKADLILGEASLSDTDRVLLSGRIKLAKGDMAAGIEQFENALRSEPGDQKTRVKLARLYLQAGMLDEARKEAVYLIRINRRSAAYKKLVAEIENAIKIEDERTKQEQLP